MSAAPIDLRDTDILPAKGIEGLALVVQDVQREYCDATLERGNEETEAIAKRISTLVPAFRAAGVKVYVVHTKPWMTMGKFYGEPHAFEPQAGDIVTEKSRNSAVSSGTLLQRLQENGTEKVLLCGFNLSACIHDTANDLLAWDMPVTLLRDLCGNDKPNAIAMSKADVADGVRELAGYGAKLSTSTKALSVLNKARP